jgi:hypothetical protein
VKHWLTPLQGFIQMVYIEVAKSQGEGTLTHHAVAKDINNITIPVLDNVGLILESITLDRYNEFVAIHGSETAV